MVLYPARLMDSSLRLSQAGNSGEKGRTTADPSPVPSRSASRSAASRRGEDHKTHLRRARLERRAGGTPRSRPAEGQLVGSASGAEHRVGSSRVRTPSSAGAAPCSRNRCRPRERAASGRTAKVLFESHEARVGVDEHRIEMCPRAGPARGPRTRARERPRTGSWARCLVGNRRLAQPDSIVAPPRSPRGPPPRAPTCSTGSARWSRRPAAPPRWPRRGDGPVPP